MQYCDVKDIDGKPAESTGDFRVEVVNTQDVPTSYVVKFDVHDAEGNFLAVGTIRMSSIRPSNSEIGQTDLPIGNTFKKPLKCSILEVR